MQYRSLPKTGEKLSVLGYGCMRLPLKGGSGPLSNIDEDLSKKQIIYAIDNGVNYLDTAYPYHRGKSESFLGEHILKNGYREKVNIATKLPCFLINKKEKIQKIFNAQLKKLQVDYIDYYLLHSLDGATWSKMLSLDIIDFMDRIKKQGKIRNIGFSFHGTYEAFKKIIDSYDWDFTQIQFNLLDENFQAGLRGIEYASNKGLGIFVMEPLRGGTLAGRVPNEVKTIYNSSSIRRSPAEWAFRWIYNHPSVTMVLSGMNDENHIKENIRVASEAQPDSLTNEDLALLELIRNKYQDLMQVSCTCCGYCLPCPSDIDIPSTLKYLNNYHMFNKTEAKLYHTLHSGIMTDDGRSHFTSSCIDCGDCEDRCPQKIAIRNEFRHVQKDIEGPVLKIISSIARLFINRHNR